MRHTGCPLNSALLLGALLLSTAHALSATAERQTLANGQVIDAAVFRGVSRWKLIPHLWIHKTVNVTCPGTSEFSTYVVATPQTVEEAVMAGQTAWCGLAGWLSWEGQQSCITRISPFQETTVAVLKPNYRGGGRACAFEVTERLWLPWLVQGALGVLLFMHADQLVDSPAFRLSSGSAGFVLLSTLIVAFIIYRSVPNKKHMAAATALFGSSTLGLLKFFFGTWIPSFDQLVTNKWVLLYMVLSGLLGLAVTYYYDDPANERLNTILKHGLQLLGLVLVALSSAAPEVSLAGALALVATRVLKLPQARHLYTWLSSNGSKVVIERRKAVVAVHGAEADPPSHRAPVSPVVTATQQASSVVKTVPAGSASGYTASEGSPTDDSRAFSGLTSPTRRRLQDQELPVSPLVERGFIINEATGRTILIGKATYNKLLKEGYQIDNQQGVMTPPTAHTSSRTSGSPRRNSSSVKIERKPPALSPYGRSSGLSSAVGIPLPD